MTDKEIDDLMNVAMQASRAMALLDAVEIIKDNHPGFRSLVLEQIRDEEIELAKKMSSRSPTFLEICARKSQ